MRGENRVQLVQVGVGGSQKLGKAVCVSRARLALALPAPSHFLFQAKQTVFIFGKFPNLFSFLGLLLPFPNLFSLADYDTTEI